MNKPQVKEAHVPARVKEVLKELPDSCKPFGWNCHGDYVLYHKTLERVAALKNVTFDMPQIVQSDAEKRICVLIVKGYLGDKSEWAVGEAMPINIDKGNNKQAFPYSMAEKRAKDKVILKLVGLHGDAYSADEADWKKIKEEKDAEIAKNKTKNGKGNGKTQSKLDSEFGEEEKTIKEIKKHEKIQEIFKHFPNAKVISVEPDKDVFRKYAKETAAALKMAEEESEVFAIGSELKASIDKYYNYGNKENVKILFNTLYNDHYATACERVNVEVAFALPNNQNQATL